MKKELINIGLGRTIDVIKLSDAFRRHARYDDRKTVRALVHEAARFSRLSTWYDPQEKFRHAELSEKLSATVQRMADLAVLLGAKGIELPVSGDSRSFFARFFNKKISPVLHLPVTVTLQKKEYKTDLSHLGRIDWRYKTPIDKGVRGMADIKTDLFLRW